MELNRLLHQQHTLDQFLDFLDKENPNLKPLTDGEQERWTIALEEPYFDP